MAKQIVMDVEARSRLLEGIDIVANSVRTTLGPKGRNVALGKKYGGPTVTHDGVTVAKEIELEEPFANMGAQLIKEAASKTNDVAGDGTTTATVLAQMILKEGLKNVAAGGNPMIIKRGIQKGVNALVEALKSQALQIKGKEEIANIAAISAADTEIGDLIAEVMDKVGKDGAITVEQSKGLEFETEYVEGLKFDRGYISPYFVTNQEQMEANIEEPFILITDKKISAVSDILPTLEKVTQSGKKEFIVIAEDIEGEALATLVVNKLRGVLNCMALKAPGYGDRRKEMLQDIAIITGGTVVSEDMGRRLDGVILEDLGRARRVISDKDNTTIVGRSGHRGRRTRADSAAQGPARRSFVGLRSRKAAGAPGKAFRRRGGHARRRRDRDRAEGEAASSGRCALRDSRRHRGRHSGGRRRCIGQRRFGA